MDPTDPPPPDVVTPPALYFNRRAMLRGAAVAASAVATGGLYRLVNGRAKTAVTTRRVAGVERPTGPEAAALGYRVDEAMTSLEAITRYNNFYEFSTDKDAVAERASAFSTSGWRVAVGGLARRPRAFTLDDLRALSPPEERVYRMRCVEAGG